MNTTPEDVAPRYCPDGHRLTEGRDGCHELACPHNYLRPCDPGGSWVGRDAFAEVRRWPERPVADPFETLALIAERRLRLTPLAARDGWTCDVPGGTYSAEGPTIGDAVRACVARIREGS
jgi:hypothetical protein